MLDENLSKNKPYRLFDLVQKKRLILFLSVDLIGSTVFKFKKNQKKNEGVSLPVTSSVGVPDNSSKPAIEWISTIQGFFISFPILFKNQLIKDEIHGYFFGKESDIGNEAEIQRTPKIFKKLGDEIIFYFELNNLAEAEFYIYCFREALKQYLSGEIFKVLPAKGAAWTAGFPVDNFVTFDGVNIQEEIIKNLNDFYNKHIDFIGPSIDSGFRLSKYSSTEKLIISIELAYILSIKRTNSMDKPLSIYFDGKYPLKGIYNNEMYPLFWISVLGDKTTQSLRSPVCDKKIHEYSKNFLLVKNGYLPFVKDTDSVDYKNKYKIFLDTYPNLDIWDFENN